MEIDWSVRGNLPSKIIGVRRNFAAGSPKDHKPVPEPWLYVKPSTAVIADGADILLPSGVNEIVAEVELGLVIGAEARDLFPKDVDRVIRGAVCGNDMTAIDLLREDGQLPRSKGLDGFCPLSRGMVPFSAIENGVELRSYVNGQQRQQGNTRDMIFSARETVAFISGWFTLWPGDVILLGTPSEAPRVEPGDVVRVEALGIGSVTNRLIRRTAPRFSFREHSVSPTA